jgi:hypothetical protein
MANHPERAQKHDLSTTSYGRTFLDLANSTVLAAKRREDLPEILRKYWVGPGRSFVPVVDRAYWLDDDYLQRIGPWIDALEQIDRRGEKKPLVALLRSERELPRDAREYLADLFERRDLKNPANRPRQPAYDRSKAESRLALAKGSVRNYQAHGDSFKDALAKAAEEWSIPEGTLANYCAGRRGSSRIKKQRHPPLTP